MLRFLPGEVATNELFRLRNQLLLIIVSTLLRFATLFALDQIVGIVPGVARGAAVLELDDATASTIEKITIVTDDHISRCVLLQKLFQPLDCVHVEMVRRLVEQQNIGRSEQQARKSEAILLSAGKLFSFQRPHVALESESLKNRLGFRGVFESTFVFELVLQIAVAFENLVEIVAGVGHAMLQLVHLMFDLLQAAKRSERRLVNRRAGFEVNVLVQQDRASRRARARRRRDPRVSSPLTRRKIVLLPAPFRPTSPTCSPGFTCRDAPRRTS